MDSMVNHMTAARKRRKEDAYSPGGQPGLRPDRATIPYAQRCREAIPMYRSSPRRRSIAAALHTLRLLAGQSTPVDRTGCKCDLIVFGMGERPIVSIAKRLAAGESIKSIRDVRGTPSSWGRANRRRGSSRIAVARRSLADKVAFARMTKKIHMETNPLNARRWCKTRRTNAGAASPDLPSAKKKWMRLQLAIQQVAASIVRRKIPAYEQIKFSVTIMRGCFGGCTFCSITTHQGRTIHRIRKIDSRRDRKTCPPACTRVVATSAANRNMYKMRCKDPATESSVQTLVVHRPDDLQKSFV